MELQDFVFENDKEFDVLVIEPSKIDNLHWRDPDYAGKLIFRESNKIVKTNPDNFKQLLYDYLEISKYKNDNMLVDISNEIIAEEPYYVYEMLYVNLKDHPNCKDFQNNENEVATLLNINDEKVYSKAIIVKNYLPSLSDSMTLVSINKEDVKRMLFERANIKIVLYNGDKWYEQHIFGTYSENDNLLEGFAKQFFDVASGNTFERLEIPFLSHNINIWYTSDYGDDGICGNLIKKPIERCMWFTMKSTEYIGNLSLDEVNKIIYLSKVLTSYKTDESITQEKIDINGRKIVKNKYKILDEVYNREKK